MSAGYGLNEEEQDIFDEYTRNRFAGAEEISEPDTSFLEVWEKIIAYAGIFGAERAINDKVCPTRPVEFSSPDTLTINMFESAAGRIPVIYGNL